MVVIQADPNAEDRRRPRTNLRASGAPPEAAAAPPRGVAGAGDDGGDSDSGSDESSESARNNVRIKESSSGVEPAEDRSANSSEECSAGQENRTAAVAHEEPTTSAAAAAAAADDALVPKVGMRFKSIEEAFLFYTAYGYRTGFGVTRRTSHSMHGKKYRQTFTCCKEGNPRVKKAVVKCRRRPIVKCGCRAMMVIKDPALKDSWVIDYVILKHNHPLDPDRVRFMKCFRELPISIKRQLHVNEFQGTLPTVPINAVISQAAENMSSSSNQKGSRNLADQMRRLRLGEGDAGALTKFFETTQLRNPSFFYSCDMDVNGLLMNVFWADARSRTVYRHFSDVVTFDTTYSSTKYHIPLVLFLGVNHHGQSILLGCGLLANESKESYIWIFKRWLRCMNDKSPSAIITNQDEAIRGAVQEVFPNARHRFCLWHIMRKLPEKLGKAQAKEEIVGNLSKAVYDSITINEFEMEWEETVVKYQLHDNEYLSSLYEDRKQWVPVYVRSGFWASVSSTHDNESGNAFFDGFVTSKTSLKKFLEQYDSVLKDKWEKEVQEDFHSSHTSPQLISGFEFEKQVAKLYTANMFQKFQDEVRHLIQCVCTRVERTGPIVTYMVTELIESRQLDYKVTYSSAEHEVWCICHSFEYSGILCRHALCVLRQEFVVILPSKYVLARWRKDFKRLQAFDSTPHMALTGELGNYDELVARGQQYLLDIADFAAFNHDMKVHALNALKEARDKVVKQEVSFGDRTVDDDSLHNTLLASNICIPPNMDVQSDGLFLASATKVFNSPRAHPKVPHKKRPVSQRERASEELKKQRKENDSIIANRNVGLHVLENQSNAGVPMTQFTTQENFAVQVGSDPSPWLYNPNPSYFYWHGASIQDPTRRT